MDQWLDNKRAFHSEMNRMKRLFHYNAILIIDFTNYCYCTIASSQYYIINWINLLIFEDAPD